MEGRQAGSGFVVMVAIGADPRPENLYRGRPLRGGEAKVSMLNLAFSPRLNI